MTISFKLSSPVSLDSYSSFTQASLSGKKSSNINVNKGATVPVYLSASNISEKHTKHAVLGQYLSGTVTFSKDEFGKKADVYPLRYILNEAPKKDKNKSNNNKKNENPGFKESLAEQKSSWVAKMDPYSDESVQLYESLKEEGVVNQASLRLAKISGTYRHQNPNLDFSKSLSIFGRKIWW